MKYMDEYRLPRRMEKGKIDPASLDEIMETESNDEISDMIPAEQLLYQNISRGEDEVDEYSELNFDNN